MITPALPLAELYQRAGVEDDDFDELARIEQAGAGNMILEQYFRQLRDILQQTAELVAISPQTAAERRDSLLDSYVRVAAAILSYSDRVRVL